MRTSLHAKLAFQGIVTFLLLSFFWTGNLSAAVIDAGLNQIQNSSFEAATLKADGNAAILPDAWRGTTSVYQRDDKVARTGKASLRYQNEDSDRYTLCVQNQNLKPGRKYRYSAWVKTEDIKGTKSDDGATLCIEWNDQNGKWLGGSYAKCVTGTSDWKQLSAIVRIPKEATSPRLMLYARKKVTGTAWFDDVELVHVVDPAFSTIVASPIYRGWIIVDEQKNAMPQEAVIRARVTLDDYDVSPEEVELHAVLRKIDDAGKPEGPVLQKASAKLGELKVGTQVLPNTADLKFSTAKLSPGTYDVETQLIGPDGKSLGVTHETLVRKPDNFKPHSRIDEHRRLLVDGKPFFPLGMYWGSAKEEDLKLYADSKFNCLMPYNSPKTEEQMDLLDKHGLKVIYSVKDWYFGSKWCPGSIKSVADEEPALRQRVQKFHNHPALLAWYLNDELPQEFMPQLEAHQRIVSEEDPDHPTWVVLYQVNQIGSYSRTCDVIGSDPYPIGRPAGKTALPAVAGQWTIETSRQMRCARPMWQVPQVFNWANYWKDEERQKNARTPSFDEMRSMSWQCIAEGATGLVLYSWQDIKRNQDVPFDVQWDRLKQIAAEIDQMAPILLSIDPAPATETLLPASPEGIHLLAKSYDGKLYLFAVNDGTADVDVHFNVKTTKPIRVLNEDRTIPTATDGFSDKSEKLSVHIYEIQP